jgi:uncharacterized phage protein gp47/JayE
MSIIFPQITASGISSPTYSEILEQLQNDAKAIFGNDIYLGADSQDGQLLAIFASALHDTAQNTVAGFNGFRPDFSTGAGLSSLVGHTGVTRRVASASQAVVTITGQAGTIITNGQVGDGSQAWALPASVVIPASGNVAVTATCTSLGDVRALPGTITKILTPSLGWQSAANLVAATPGAPVESDAELRARRSVSVALPSVTTLAGVRAGILALPGVSACAAYENDTGVVDSRGIPEHSISMVVTGGNSANIAETISRRKCTGTGTFGAVTISVTNNVGITQPISYYTPAPKQVYLEVRIRALAGYSSASATLSQSAILNYITGLLAGDPLFISRLYLPAQLFGANGSETFELISILASTSPGGPFLANDIPVQFFEECTSSLAGINMILVP